MAAAGRTKVIRDQPTGDKPFYFKLGQKTILISCKCVCWLPTLISKPEWYEFSIFDGNRQFVKHQEVDAPTSLLIPFQNRISTNTEYLPLNGFKKIGASI
jgi:hypothetical protein